jgi:hypothetical protein
MPHNSLGPKLAKFFNFWEQFNLGNGFRILGRFIGTYPLAFLISSLILASLSFGMYKLEVKDRVRDGYTPATSLARYETDVLKEFLGSTGKNIWIFFIQTFFNHLSGSIVNHGDVACP